jgi:hypothetical protein
VQTVLRLYYIMMDPAADNLQGWDLTVVQPGFSNASYGGARHQRRLIWNSYGV